MLKKTAFVFVLMLFALPAHADEFVKPTFAGMLQTMLRMKALTLDDNSVVDDYAIVTECKLYSAFYADDFKWNSIRAAIRDAVQKNMPAFPVAYYYSARLQLDRYDFDDKLFRFTDKTTIDNVNAFGLYKAVSGDCPDGEVRHLPALYRAVLDAPVSIAGLPLGAADAQALLQQMKDDKNTDRVVYVRFNMHVVYIEPLHLDYKSKVSGGLYTQTGSTDPRAARFDARLDSIDFYEDEDNTKLIYSYKS